MRLPPCEPSITFFKVCHALPCRAVSIQECAADVCSSWYDPLVPGNNYSLSVIAHPHFSVLSSMVALLTLDTLPEERELESVCKNSVKRRQRNTEMNQLLWL